MATHTTVAELVKAKIDSEEFRPSLELEQFILEGGATDYLEQVKSPSLSLAGTVFTWVFTRWRTW